jgi:hypothetical protein
MLHEIQLALRTTAERHDNDIIANAASALVVRLETVNTAFGMHLGDLTQLDQQLIRTSLQFRQTAISS